MIVEIDPDLIEALARRAKALTEGMVSRTQRRPDVADYRVAFEDEIRKFPFAPVLDRRMIEPEAICEIDSPLPPGTPVYAVNCWGDQRIDQAIRIFKV